MYCPQCGTQNPDRNRFCSNCGGSIAGQAPTVVGIPQQQAAPAPAYSPAPAAPGTLRRAGNLLVATPGAQFPPYCVKCGQPAQKWLTKNFSWHPGWLYVLALWPIVYIIVAIVVSKRMRLTVPMCSSHFSTRRMLLTFGWLCMAGFLPAFIIIMAAGNGSDEAAGIGVLVMFAMLIASIVLLVIGSRVIRVQEITMTEAIFSGISPAFLPYVSEQPPAAMAAAATMGSAQMR